MSKALIPGSFDPITAGHLRLIERAARLFDEVVVAVMTNSEKQPLFPLQKRVDLAKKSLAHLPNVTVIGDDGMLIDLFDAVGADAVVKGIRNAEDLAWETRQADWNRAHNPRFETLYLPCEEEYADVSSTRARRAIQDGDTAQMKKTIPAAILPDISGK